MKRMTSGTTRTLICLIAATVLSGSAGLAQTATPPPSTPAPSSAPAGQPPMPPGGMRPGTNRPGPQGRGQQGGGPPQGGGQQGRQGMQRSGMMQRGGRQQQSRSRGMAEGGMRGGFHIVPPGMWWRNSTTVTKLTLTPEQVKKMDDIFQQSRIQLIDLKANVEKQDVMLEPMLSANPPDMAKTLGQIDRVAQARADLEKADAKMLLSIRMVLTPDQWTKLHTPGGGPGAGPGPGMDGAGGQGGPGGPRGQRRGGPGGEDIVAPEGR